MGLLALGNAAQLDRHHRRKHAMIRPVIKMNSWRKRKRHIIVFLFFWFPT
ncbi:MAG: hypothetical protein ACLUOI_11065 [Eisenbergiella sp.]